MKRAVYNSSWLLRETAKIFLNGRAIKRGGGKAGQKKNFFGPFFCCNLKIKDILLKTTYQNINTGNVGKVVVL